VEFGGVRRETVRKKQGTRRRYHPRVHKCAYSGWSACGVWVESVPIAGLVLFLVCGAMVEVMWRFVLFNLTLTDGILTLLKKHSSLLYTQTSLMKVLMSFIAIAISLQALAQKDIPKTKAENYEDSVFRYYVKERAWRQPLFSRERERYLDSALALLPHNAYLWQQRGMPLIKQNKYELSMRYIDSAVKYDPQKWLDYRAMMKCIFAKTYRESLKDFDEARRLNGNIGVMDHPYDFYSGLCYLQLNEFDSAEIYVRKCIENTRKTIGESWIHYVHWFYLGVIRHEKEDYAGALEYLNKSLKEYPNFSDANFYKAKCLMKLNQPKEALVAIRQAKADFDKGYTMNEDQVIYETYPYQVKGHSMKGTLAWIEEENEKK
jgi:tetratricopeptide (TPR) repeat protein